MTEQKKKVLLTKKKQQPKKVYKKKINIHTLRAMSHDQAIDAIVFLGNPEFTLLCLEDKKLNFTKREKMELLARCKDAKLIQRVARKTSTGIDEIDIVNIIRDSKDDDFIKEYLEDPNNRLSRDEKVDLLLGIKDISYIKHYVLLEDVEIEDFMRALIVIEDKELKDVRFHLKSPMSDSIFLSKEQYREQVMPHKTGDYLEQLEERAKLVMQVNPKIDTIAQLTVEDVENSSTIKTVSVGDYVYSKREYLQIRKVVDEILDGVHYPRNNRMSQLETFREIYMRLAKKISYDHEILKNKDESIGSQEWNLYAGLIKDKCVCAGYAHILKNVLSCVGIECNVISGSLEYEKEGHAWNQVKIGKHWFNVDLTNDRDKVLKLGDSLDIRNFLHKDTFFYNNVKYSRNQTPREECKKNPYEYFSEISSGIQTLKRVINKSVRTIGLKSKDLKQAFETLCTDVQIRGPVTAVGTRIIDKIKPGVEEIKDWEGFSKINPLEAEEISWEE